ncbi:hypothetical protein CMUS01_16092 [Colletotrichum musicola]|uniref:FAR1 domain-containing protein n=1 Tax=Colletotrichum musicola TaxID=2175873 RepID=A0A8H6IR36_9PEZI|nr:hypothetical protein CMUS01_16092 [Colletotrichum musicola]
MALPMPSTDVANDVKTIEELQNYLNVFAREHGFAIVRKNGSAKRNGVNTWWALKCDRDTVRSTKSVGLRKTTMRKVGCT